MTADPWPAERIRAGMDALARIDPDIRALRAEIGDPPPFIRPPGFATLLRTMSDQMLSTHAAEAIWRRVEAAAGGTPEVGWLLARTDAELRALGFSARKVEYARVLAGALHERSLDLDALHRGDDEAITAELVRLRGFGPWTAEVYLLMALGRGDAFPAGDLALQVGYQWLKRLETRPSGPALRAMVEPWRPWRGVGAFFLWHHYLREVPERRRRRPRKATTAA